MKRTVKIASIALVLLILFFSTFGTGVIVGVLVGVGVFVGVGVCVALLVGVGV